MRKVMCAALFLVSSLCSADRVASITIFQTDDHAVSRDLSVANKHIPITVYSMDLMDKFENALDAKIKQRLPHFQAATPMESHTKAFLDLLNSKEWPELASKTELAAESVGFAIRYQVKKLPAIIFNDQSIVYGVRSLREAMVIYNRAGGAY